MSTNLEVKMESPENGSWIVAVAYRRSDLTRDMLNYDDAEVYSDCTLTDAAKAAADTNDPEGYLWHPGSRAYAYVFAEGGGPLHLVRMRMRAGEYGTGDAKIESVVIVGEMVPAEPS